MVDPKVDNSQTHLNTLRDIPHYLVGKLSLDEITSALNVLSYKDLSVRLGVPTSTISAWHTHDRTPYEVLVRIHLRIKTPMPRLALGQGNFYESPHEDEWWEDSTLPIEAFDYLKGRAVVERMMEATQSKTIAEFAKKTGVSRATINTWITHDRTPFELIIRIHLFNGTPVHLLALEKWPDDEEADDTPAKVNPQKETQSTNEDFIVILKSFCLSDGVLLDTGEIPYSVRIFNSWNLDKVNSIEIETNEGRFIVDKSTTNPVSGKYLIDIDGVLSFNHIQRLPGRKLVVVFGDATVEVAEEDIKVIGRVAVTLKKD